MQAVLASLTGSGDPILDARPEIPASALNTVYFPPASRSLAPKLAVPERTFDAEIEGDIGAAEALREAARCLSCGNCLACDNCWTFCPDNAVIKTQELATDGSHYVFDLDYCKGCGLCALECPTGYIQMQPEAFVPSN